MRSTLTSVCVLFLLAGCGAERPATVRAIAVGMGALGTGMATAAHACVDLSGDACEKVAITSAVAVFGMALSAAAVAFLGHPAAAAVPLAPQPVAPFVAPMPDPLVTPDPLVLPSPLPGPVAQP